MNLITGATGLLGSHIAEQLAARGEPVRALVRPGSDTRFLVTLGAELCPGDLNDPESLARALKGVRAVYHAAAKVGDWGPWSAFQRDVIDGTRNLAAASLAAGVARFLHVSSTSAYGHPRRGAGPVDETFPLGSRFWLWDHYTRAKVEAEKLLWAMHAARGLPLTVIRPSWIYGPRDRTTIHRLARLLSGRRLLLIGWGSNPLCSVYAGNVAEACILAAGRPEALGQAYNISSDGPISQRQYLNLFADALGRPRPWILVPYAIAFGGAFVFEAAYRLVRARRPPFVTRYATWLMGRTTVYTSLKAETQLGWRPSVNYAEGVRRTVDWYLGQRP